MLLLRQKHLGEVSLKRHGFTLIELLLGVIMTAIIGASIYSIFHAGLKIDTHSRTLYEQQMETWLALEALANDLNRVINLDMSMNYPDARAFIGEATSLSAIVTTGNGLMMVTYGAGPSKDWALSRTRAVRLSTDLVKKENPEDAIYIWRKISTLPDALNNSNDSQDPQVMAGGLMTDGLVFSYADYPQGAGQPLIFKDRWNKETLPAAVRCQITLKPKDPNQKPVVMVKDMALTPLLTRENKDEQS